MAAVNPWRHRVILVGLLLWLVGCGASPVDSGDVVPSEATSTPHASPSTPATAEQDRSDHSPTEDSPESSSTPANPTTASPGTVPVIIYRVNHTCTDFIAEPARVNADQAMQATVRQILSDQAQAQFGLAGFRVTLDDDSQIATIDLRLSPDSSRQFVSLSTCEQMALFGSLRETLLQNSQWQVDAVEFTERGQEITL